MLCYIQISREIQKCSHIHIHSTNFALHCEALFSDEKISMSRYPNFKSYIKLCMYVCMYVQWCLLMLNLSKLFCQETFMFGETQVIIIWLCFFQVNFWCHLRYTHCSNECFNGLEPHWRINYLPSWNKPTHHYKTSWPNRLTCKLDNTYANLNFTMDSSLKLHDPVDQHWL